jgi:hypothetical protein
MPKHPSQNSSRIAAALALAAVAGPTSVALAADDGGLDYIHFSVPAGRIVEDGLADHARATLIDRAVLLERRAAKLGGTKISARRVRAKLHGLSIERLERRVIRLQRRVTTLKRSGGAPAIAIPAALASIAACESGGNPRAIGGGGAYRGKYQFDYGTWARVGGSGDPAAATELEQDRRAAMLYARAGSSPWPVCG